MEDYTAELAASHGISYYVNYTSYDKLRKYVTDIPLIRGTTDTVHQVQYIVLLGLVILRRKANKCRLCNLFHVVCIRIGGILNVYYLTRIILVKLLVLTRITVVLQLCRYVSRGRSRCRSR